MHQIPDQLLKSMNEFYTLTESNISFYKKNGRSVSEVMLKVGKYLKTQGKFAAAEKTLSDGIHYKQNEKDNNFLI